MRIIKKYPNRRLYDTELSRYITLNDVRKLVLRDIDFQVKDVKSDQDLTHNILMQIMAEQEFNHEPIFSESTLLRLIRLYNNNESQDSLSDYLQNSLELFEQQRDDYQKLLLEGAAKSVHNSSSIANEEQEATQPEKSDDKSFPEK